MTGPRTIIFVVVWVELDALRGLKHHVDFVVSWLGSRAIRVQIGSRNSAEQRSISRSHPAENIVRLISRAQWHSVMKGDTGIYRYSRNPVWHEINA